MNKDFSFKHDPEYGYSELRNRISNTIKHLRDDAEEVKNPEVKSLPIIPVTGGKNLNDKFFNNKSLNKF